MKWKRMKNDGMKNNKKSDVRRENKEWKNKKE